MATHALIDASIDSFWAAAGVPCPAPNGRKKKSALPKLPGQGYCQGPKAAVKPKLNEAIGQEFKKVVVEISGREGYNSAALNGVWHFWKVKSGRLAFDREIQLREAADEDSDASPRDLDEDVKTLRLFLFYVPQTDAWIISDSPDLTGNVIADCGPLNEGKDLEQTWRVWDGDGWKEDHNISAEIIGASELGCAMAGLALGMSPLSARGPVANRARRAEQREDPRVPLTARRRTPRQLDSL